MKYAVLIPDGMADYPLEVLNGLTPLEAADTPNMDFLSQRGILGRVSNIPKGFSPASDVAILSILGYDPVKFYTGRGPLEAANLGVKLEDNDIAFRCNLISAADGKILDYSAGHITTKEAKVLIEYINDKLGSQEVSFHAGTSYRHIMRIKNSPIAEDLSKLECKPPHDIIGKEIKKNLPRGKHAGFIIDFLEKSKELLAEHEVNHVRLDLGENPANMIWLWGQGKKPSLPSFKDKYGLSGAAISAVDLIKGMSNIIGLDVCEVPGATGYYDTNYKGKADAAVKALKNHDLVFVHIEATDEAGHNADIREKMNAIKNFDHIIVGGVLEGLKKYKEFKILVLPDHPTPIALRTHTSEPVCFLIYNSNENPGKFTKFSEKEAEKSDLYIKSGCELMDYFIKGKS